MKLIPKVYVSNSLYIYLGRREASIYLHFSTVAAWPPRTVMQKPAIIARTDRGLLHVAVGTGPPPDGPVSSRRLLPLEEHVG